MSRHPDPVHSTIALPDSWQQAPYASYLAIQAEAGEDDALNFRLPYEERMLGNPVLQVFHGGVITAFVESSAQLWWSLTEASPMLPDIMTTTIDFLRPASNRAGGLLARPRLIRAGKRVAILQVDIHCGDKQVAGGRVILAMM